MLNIDLLFEESSHMQDPDHCYSLGLIGGLEIVCSRPCYLRWRYRARAVHFPHDNSKCREIEYQSSGCDVLEGEG